MFYRIAHARLPDYAAGCMGWGYGTREEADHLCDLWKSWEKSATAYVVVESAEEAPESWLDLGAEIAAWEHGERP
jgi:hypothetical protein